jgi:hypothetical protein
MGPQNLVTHVSGEMPSDVRSQEAVEKLLRSRLSRFLTEPAPWKQNLREIVEAFKQTKWDAVVFGGVLRDLALYGPAERPRDVDIVVNCSSYELGTWLSAFPSQRTRFGGFRVRLHKWNFDIWTLRETWAFTTSDMEPTFENLPKTTFFNIEGVAAQLNTAPRQKRAVYSCGFADAISSKILDINFEPNPFPQLCIVRGLLTAVRHRLLLSSRLARYMASHANRTEIAEIVQVQSGHYGVVRLRRQDIELWLDHIENSLKGNSDTPVRLPSATEGQMDLPTPDHCEVA